MSGKQVTQADIARAAGVSQETVSLALRSNSSRINAETRQMVLEFAAKLGYRQNQAAKAIRFKRNGAIAILRSRNMGFSNMPEEFLLGIQPKLSQAQLRLSIGYLPASFKSHEEALQTTTSTLMDLMVDGILVNMTEMTSPIVMDAIAKQALPAVWFNAKLAADCVFPDEFSALRDVSLFLHANGYARLLYIGPTAKHATEIGAHRLHFSSIDRRDGYLDAISGLGMKPECVSLDELSACCFRSIASQPCKTAVLAAGPHEALGALMAAREAGADTTSKTLIAYCSNAPFWLDQLDCHLRLIPIPWLKMAAESIELLAAKIEGAAPPGAAPVKVKYDSSKFNSLLSRGSYIGDAP